MMSSDKPASDLRGQRLLPVLIDELGRDRPDKIWASLTVSSRIQDGFRDVSYSQLARAINLMARWIEAEMGLSSSFDTVCYLGAADVRYWIIMVALIKTGYTMLCGISHKESHEVQAQMMKQADCNIVLHASSIARNTIPSISATQSKVLCIPELEFILSQTHVPSYPFTRPFREVSRDPILKLQTSGTTGPRPKLVILTHAHFATIDAHSIPSSLDGRENIYNAMRRCDRHYSARPFDRASSFTRFLRATLVGAVMVVGPDRYIGKDKEHIDHVRYMLHYGRVSAAHFTPEILEALVKDPDALTQLSQLRFIGWGGSALPKKVGNTLLRVCKDAFLHNSLGSIDGGAFVNYMTDSEDWGYICFCPYYNGIVWEDHGDGLFELVVERKPELEMFQACFKTFPHLDRWSSKDLYSKHPSKPHHWCHECRIDDLITMSNGKNYNPHTLLASLEEHPAVRSAMMIGGHTVPALLIELIDPSQALQHGEHIREELWPIIEASNKVSPYHGQVQKSLTYVAGPGEPFPRTVKGSVQRKKLLEQFQDKIDGMYDGVEATENNNAEPKAFL